MGRTTRDKILDTAIGATSGLTAILAVSILLSPNFTRDVIIIGALVLAFQLVLEWRDAAPATVEPHND